MISSHYTQRRGDLQVLKNIKIEPPFRRVGYGIISAQIRNEGGKVHVKKMTAILAVLLAALLLCGAALLNGWYNEDGTEVPRFEDMPYERPDPEAFAPCRSAHDVVQMLAAIGGRWSLLDELFTVYYSARTMLTLADIRSCQDLTDDYWAEEYGACLPR